MYFAINKKNTALGEEVVGSPGTRNGFISIVFFGLLSHDASEGIYTNAEKPQHTLPKKIGYTVAFHQFCWLDEGDDRWDVQPVSTLLPCTKVTSCRPLRFSLIVSLTMYFILKNLLAVGQPTSGPPNEYRCVSYWRCKDTHYFWHFQIFWQLFFEKKMIFFCYQIIWLLSDKGHLESFDFLPEEWFLFMEGFNLVGLTQTLNQIYTLENTGGWGSAPLLF